MEHLNYSPFPEIEALKSVMPDAGIAFHGTSFENAERILSEGFKRLQFIHYYFVSPNGKLENSDTTQREFKNALSIAFENGYKHSPLIHPKLILFISKSPLIHSLEHYDLEKRIEMGFPIQCRARSGWDMKILGAVDFGIEDGTNTLHSFPQTMENIVNFLKNFSEPQQPTQE